MDSLISNQPSVSSPDIPVTRSSIQNSHTYPPEGSSSDQNSPVPDVRYDRRAMAQNPSFTGATPSKDSAHHPYYSSDHSERTESIQNTPYGYPFMSPPPPFRPHQLASLSGYGQDPQEFGMEKDYYKKNNLSNLNDPLSQSRESQYQQYHAQNMFSTPSFQPQHYQSQNVQQYQHHFQSQQYQMQQQQHQQQQQQLRSSQSTKQKGTKRPKSPTDSVSSKDNDKDTQDDEQHKIRRRKKRLLKKAPNAPKRGKSAYICYSIAKRPEIQAELGPNAKATDVVVRIASTWRDLPEEEKKVWEKKAFADKRRYEHEIQEYDGPMKVPNKRIKKNPDAPKRGMSAFLLYSQVMRSKLKQMNPTSKNTEISRMLGEYWNQLPLDKKQPYIDQANEENLKYLTEMGYYKQAHITESTPSTPLSAPSTTTNTATKKTPKSNQRSPSSGKKEKKTKKQKNEGIENYEI